MFYCEITNNLSKIGEKPIRLVTERRERLYSIKDHHGNDVVIGRGWEIVKEVNVTLAGLEDWCTHHPEDTQSMSLLSSMKVAEELRRQLTLKEEGIPPIST